MRIADIKLESTAEIYNRFADIIYVQGCCRNPPCGYCFNPDLIPTEGGKEMTTDEIISQLSDFSDAVVITGGDPVCQRHELFKLIYSLQSTNKKIVLETSFCDMPLFCIIDKILLTLKSFDAPSEDDFITINAFKNVLPCIVIGHKWFDNEGFKKILKGLKKTLYYRFSDGWKHKFMYVYKMAKMYKVEFKKFDKIWI